ncbi:tetraacyldisaccharide 4'-kinase [Fibrella forsythiae]|uniref:Tetraacyldisaccharide 4'-kinase n=1 Tax=Fibrella forsythiae TaxID=2817061 RepID=A0ABS3JGK4_9BACT|nr:tetraacyldisaccharide 4'-kinase [Fibrella forsythiae]MBO0949137.1 tetraacyldisaccharide 4'-kinase [Fibrella forsythiae]
MTYKNLLKPLSLAYGGVLALRNVLYDHNFVTTYIPTQRCISVGNLTVGGTGKTPAVEYLLRYLQTLDPALTGEIATLSRGYGRQTHGFRVATSADSAATIGDEPLQLFRNFSPAITITVGERRADALRQLALEQPEIRTVVLDDAYQHRAVQPQLNLLLTDYYRPFYTDDPFPGGRLRERRTGARRADAVIVTKCPHDLSPAEQATIDRQIRRYTEPVAGAAKVPILFAGLAYGQPRLFGGQAQAQITGPVQLVSGLAHADPLVRYVANTWGVAHHTDFGDHYAYTRADVDQLVAQTPTETWFLTTQKDEVKLAPLLTESEQKTGRFAYLPVSMTFLGQEDAQTLARLVVDCLRGPALKNR